MTKLLNNKALRGVWRRRLFVSWVAVSVAAAIYIAIAAPLAVYRGGGWAYVAVPALSLMFFMMATGLVWLTALAMSRPKNDPKISSPAT